MKRITRGTYTEGFLLECTSVSGVRRVVLLLHLSERMVVAINIRLALFIIRSLVDVLIGFAPVQGWRQFFVFLFSLLVLIRVISWLHTFVPNVLG